MRQRPALVAALAAALMITSARAQDFQADPADAEAAKALLKKATRAILEKDARGFVSCCDSYVDCFFAEGVHIKGHKRIEKTLGEYFAARPAELVITLDAAPRSYRVLTPDVLMVDWPATLKGPEGALTVNTLTTLRKSEGKWFITSFLQSVPYTLPGREGVLKKAAAAAR